MSSSKNRKKNQNLSLKALTKLLSWLASDKFMMFEKMQATDGVGAPLQDLFVHSLPLVLCGWFCPFVTCRFPILANLRKRGETQIFEQPNQRSVGNKMMEGDWEDKGVTIITYKQPSRVGLGRCLKNAFSIC